jgi:hypothetical protein
MCNKIRLDSFSNMTGGDRMGSILVSNKGSFHRHHVQMAVKISMTS